MADFKQTPASRVFGMGLPRRSSLPPATFFETPIYEERRNLNPMVRQNAVSEQETLMQEQALADQQAQMDRQRRVMEAEDAAIADIEAGADIGNVFKQRPGLALSRNFNQFANMAQMVQPSKATSTLAPSLAKTLNPEDREEFFRLAYTDPRYMNDPLGAQTEVLTRRRMLEQQGELEKAGISNYPKDKLLSPPEMARMIREASNKGKDPAMEAMEKQMGMLRDELKFMADSGDFEIPNPAASASDPSIPKFIPRPEYAARQKKLMELSDRYQSYLEGIHSPQQAAAAAAGASPPPQAEPQVGFKDRMKGLAGGQPTIPQVKDEEVIADLNSPDAGLDTFTAAIDDLKTSPRIKEEAVKKLEEFVKKPVFPKGTNSRQAENQLNQIKAKIEEGKKAIRLFPEIQKYMKAWDEEKSQVEKWIAEFAAQSGADPELVAADIAQEEPTTDDPENPFTYKDKFEQFLAKKLGTSRPFSQEAKRLSPFQKGEFATELGVKSRPFSAVTPTGILGSMLQGFGILPTGAKTYGDVIDAYFQERFGHKEQPQASPEAQTDIFNVSTKEEVDALPKGSKFRGPDGKVRIK